MASNLFSGARSVALAAVLSTTVLAQQATKPAVDQQRTSPQPRTDSQPSKAAADPAANAVISVRDELSVTTLNVPDFTVKAFVDADGTFEFSHLGRVPAAGLTPRQLEDQLKTRLDKEGWLIKPQVSVEVVSSLSKRVLVGGRVRAPGQYPFMGQFTVLNAITDAGFVTDDAGERAFIIRGNPDGTMVSAEQMSQAQKVYVDLHKLLTLGDLSENYTLNNGDYIYVEQAQPFTITGEVKSPGSFAVRRDLTVFQAVALAGGLTDKGKYNGIKITRPGVKGDIQVKDDKDARKQLVKPGDTISVPSKIL